MKNRKLSAPNNTPRSVYYEVAPTALGQGTAKNEAGGQVYRADDWVRLERFLILGSSEGGYYTTPQELTQQNLENINDCLHSDGVRVLDMVCTISTERRAARQEPALLVLAALFCHHDVNVRQAAAAALPVIARTGTHLFTFVSLVRSMRGWGRTLRTAISRWYGDKDIDHLVNLLIKYQQRAGWSNRDLLRLVHTHPKDKAQDAAFFWAVGGDISKLKPEWQEALHNRIYAIEGLKRCISDKSGDNTGIAASLIEHNNLPREVVPTELLNSPVVWESLMRVMLEQRLDEALLRNLGRMSSLSLFKYEDILTRVVSYLRSCCRAHPIKILTALNQYSIGHSNFRNKEGEFRNTWTPNQYIVSALEAAFYSSFQYIKPSNKHILLAIDVSGSMRHSTVAGLDNMTTVQAAACMAMVFLRTERQVAVIVYNGSARPLEIDPEWSLKHLSEYICQESNGSTNCSAPMQYIVQNRLPVDAIINLTDTQHWDGPPCGPELDKARQATGRPIKHVVVAMCPTRWTISNPNDALSIDCVGYDSHVPRIIQNFVGGGFENEEE